MVVETSRLSPRARQFLVAVIRRPVPWSTVVLDWGAEIVEEVVLTGALEDQSSGSLRLAKDAVVRFPDGAEITRVR